MRKGSKVLWITVGILAALVLLLVILTAVLLFGGKEEKQDDSGNAGPFVVKENGLADFESTEGWETASKEGKEESTLSFGGEKITFCVPDGFCSDGTYEADSYITEAFYKDKYAVTADCYFWPASEENGYQDAKTYVEYSKDWLMENVGDETEIKTVTVDGKTCYYFYVCYEYKNTDYQKVSMACDLENGGFFAVEVQATDWEEQVAVDELEKFFDFR
jgi:hypothetical protein